MHVIVRIQWLAGNVSFPAGEARQRMHISAACPIWMPDFGEIGATTRIYGNRFSDGIGAGGKKRRLPG